MSVARAVIGTVAWAAASAAASAAAAPFAYVAADEFHEINVIDLATNATSARIAIGPAPIVGMAVSPAGDRAYVTDSLEGRVRVIDTATNRVTATISVCNGAFIPALNPSGSRLVVPCGAASGGVDVIDTSTNAVIARVAAGAGPVSAIWNPSGTRFYVSNSAAGTISVFDATSLSQVQTITGLVLSSALAFDASGTRLFAAGYAIGGNAIAVIEPASGETVATIPLAARASWIEMNPARTRLYVSQYETNSVLVIDPVTYATVGRIETGRAAALDFSADGTRLYVQLPGQLAVFDTSTLLPVSSAVYGHPNTSMYGRFIVQATSPVAAPAANTPGALSGQWWNPGESGWGIHLTERGNTLFAVWYTYDSYVYQIANAGVYDSNYEATFPRWYVATCTKSSPNQPWSGSILRVAGSRFVGIQSFDSGVRSVPEGTLALSFTGSDNGTMAYTVNGVSRTVAIERQRLQASGSVPDVNYTDLWWSGTDESGWGLAITHQFSTMFLAWFVYDDGNAPVWYVSTIRDATVSGGSGVLLRTQYQSSTDPVRIFQAGTITVTFTDANHGTIRYDVSPDLSLFVHGGMGSKNITRQIF